jgi:hypothetical protein
MLQPTSLQWNARSVEWVRSEVPFGDWLVDEGEHIYYSLNAPKTGGPQLKSLPTVGLNPPRTSLPSIAKAHAQAAAWPPPIKPVFPHPLPGEGAWRPTGPPVDDGPPVLVTTFRPELDYPQLVAYVAWFDHTRTEIAYYPGRYEPPNAGVRGPMMVPDDQRWRLLATFNAGFTYTDGDNGSADNGRTNEPLKDGNATLIGYRDHRIAIVKWSSGPNVGPDVAWAPEPGSNRLERTTKPTAERQPEQPAVGLHARRPHSRLAHRCRHRPAWQPHLRCRRRPDGDHPWRRSCSAPVRCGRWSSTSTLNGTP